MNIFILSELKHLFSLNTGELPETLAEIAEDVGKISL